MSTITAPHLSLVLEAGEALMALTAGLSQGEFLASLRTRTAAAEQLATLAGWVRELPTAVTRALPAIDWAGWRAVWVALGTQGPAHEQGLWFGVHTLLPDTLEKLRAQRRMQPGLFTDGP